MMPHGEQREQPGRKGAMNGQLRSDNAVPVLHRTTGPNRLIPSRQQIGGNRLPRRVKTVEHVFAGWTKHRPTQPCPGHQRDCSLPQGVRDVRLESIQTPSKQQSLGQGQTDLLGKYLDVPPQSGYRAWCQFAQQVQRRDDLALALFATENATSADDDDLQQGMQLLAGRARTVGDRSQSRDQSLRLRKGCLGAPSSRSWSVCLAFGLPLDDLQTVVLDFHCTVKPSLPRDAQRDGTLHKKAAISEIGRICASHRLLNTFSHRSK
jgi:hypothetical protein